QTEFCLLGIKGRPEWNLTNERDIIREARREHSRKPESFYQMIEKLNTGKKIDYFGRYKRNGWDIYGNEIR
ncbi:MAG: MT-A70 family methyltransferase, partial [Candidatus Pacearchaeota archaeon]|nr:MT-A70 family methyltransferase [Candidatus Pacearchaeota archaeon]